MLFFFFFFQAEDGIRDWSVTGVQTCALPILRYLIEDKQIVYLTAADVMNAVQPPDEEKSKEGMVAFGNPTGANLPSAEDKVKGIAQVFPSTEVLFGPDVTKKTLGTEEKLSKRIVHFATHGILNASAPLASYIQLAASDSPA